jgi:hypothetical protein
MCYISTIFILYYSKYHIEDTSYLYRFMYDQSYIIYKCTYAHICANIYSMNIQKIICMCID